MIILTVGWRVKLRRIEEKMGKFERYLESGSSRTGGGLEFGVRAEWRAGREKGMSQCLV